jgi:hypothetical protein
MTFDIATPAGDVALWGFIATAFMTMVLTASQHLGLSRMSLPFLVGTVFTANRRWAEFIGLILYILGGWVFAALYALVFESLGHAGWMTGGIVGAAHGLFLLSVALPVAPALHPRMASPYDGPEARRRIEPPGFLGLNYGRWTPLSTMIGQTLYGIILGAAYHV